MPDWKKPLTRAVTTREGKTVRTLAQAARLALDSETRERSSWQGAAQMLMTAADSGRRSDIEVATKQLELALFLENRLQMKTSKASPKSK